MSAAQGVGDRHPGQWLPFWERACQKGRPRACAYLASLQSIYCGAGSGWACNESGMIAGMNTHFERGCRLGFVPACRNAGRVGNADPGFEQAPPTLADYPILLRGSKGPITDRTRVGAQARACAQGWRDAAVRRLPESRPSVRSLVRRRGLLIQLVRRAGAGRSHEQLLAIFERDVATVGATRAVLRPVPVDDDHGARQQRLPA